MTVQSMKVHSPGGFRGRQVAGVDESLSEEQPKCLQKRSVAGGH